MIENEINAIFSKVVRLSSKSFESKNIKILANYRRIETKLFDEWTFDYLSVWCSVYWNVHIHAYEHLWAVSDETIVFLSGSDESNLTEGHRGLIIGLPICYTRLFIILHNIIVLSVYS